MANAIVFFAHGSPKRAFALRRCCFLLTSSLPLLLVCAGCLRGITEVPARSNEGKSLTAALPVSMSGATFDLKEMEGLLRTMASQRNAQGSQELQTVDGWYRTIVADELAPLPRNEYRWHHKALSEFLTAYPDDVASLRVASKSTNAHIAAAGVIGIARLEPKSSPRPLLKLIYNAELSDSVRCAAVETLAREPSIEREGLLRNLLELYGPTWDQTGPTPQLVSAHAKLHAELLLGLARQGDIAHEPALIEALALRDADIQVVSLALLVESKATLEPDQLPPLLHSEHGRVRRAALVLVVAGQPKAAFEHLEQATRDSDISVRLQAIELLGKLKDRDSLQCLYSLLDDPAERHREVAACALVKRQEWAGVERAARDKSYRVRSAVAVALRDHGQRERLDLAQTLLNDTSAIVQAKMAESLAGWPEELAGPMLLTSMASPNFLTRQVATESLKASWPKAVEFVPSAPTPERNQMWKALASQWRNEHPLAATDVAEVAAGSKQAPNKAKLNEIDRLLARYQAPPGSSERWLAQKQLEKLGPDLLPALESLLAEKRIRIEEATYRELLANSSDTMATIEQLRSVDVAERRAAARKLAGRAAADPLTSLPLGRIEQLGSVESDPLVWNDLLRVASESPDYEAQQLSRAALAHGEADVRRRGCEYLAKCGTYQQGTALLPLLNDKDVVVKKTAVVALGRCGPIDEREPLYELLNDGDVAMQIAAAKTLSQWHDERGKAALERFALAATPTTRRQALVAMGELADADFLPSVMQALDDQPAVQLAALGALPKLAAEDPCAAESRPPASAAERAKVWQAWYEAKQTKSR